MKKQTLIFAFAALAFAARAQLQTPLSLISTAGGTGQATISGNANTVQWTIGETFIGSGTSGSQSVTIGEQQGLPNDSTGTGIKENVFSRVKVYPNPASNFVQIDNLPDGSKTILLTDITGKTVQSLTTADRAQTFSTAHLATGIYTLSIGRETNAQKSFKISITNN